MAGVPFWLREYRGDYDQDSATLRLLRRVDECMDGLRSHCDPLPRVDEDGHSECPFYETLYGYAAEWRAVLVDHIRQLNDHAAAAKRAMDEAQRRGREWEDDGDPRHTDDWKRFREAYESHRARRATILEKKRLAEQALAAADAVVAERRSS